MYQLHCKIEKVMQKLLNHYKLGFNND